MPRNTPSVQLLRRSPRRLKAAISANVSRPGLARSNTRSVAAQEGQEFLNALGFDPSVKRSVIAPRRFTVVLSKAPRIRKSRIAPVAAAPTAAASSGKGKVRQQQNAKKQARAAKIASVKASVAAAATQPKLASAPLAAPQFAPSRFGGAVAPPAPQAQVPAVWKFKSTVPAFALHVSPSAVFFGDQSGRVVMFDHSGNTKQQVQLPAGVKSLVADTRWLYAGCDNGGVYDLTDPQNPRLAYVLPNSNSTNDAVQHDEAPEPDENAMDIDDASTRLDDFSLPSIRRKHVTFVVDTSGSMSGALIQSAVNNVLSIIENQLADDDFISVIKFNTTVTSLFSGRTKAQHADSITTSVRSLIFASGATALWSAFSKGFETLNTSNLPADLEQWVVVLTDGANNVHNPGVDAASVTNLASQNNTHIIAISVGNTTNADSLAQICNAASAKGCASKHICVSASSQGVDEAFKIVAQLLNARVTSLSIADGLVSISDADGKITVCNIDGVKLWSHKAAHRGGWMVRADARSVFQGHDGGVTRFNLRNGAIEASQVLSGAVMSGCQTPDSLFIASGSNIFWFSKTNNTAHVVASVAPALIISNAAGMINNQVCLFTADSSGAISCFHWDASQPSTAQAAKWRLSCSEIGTPLSMQAFEDKLYVATMKGCLACIDISAESIARGAAAIQCIEKNVDATVGAATAAVPSQKLPTTNDASQGIVVECKHDLADSEVLDVHKAIHDPSATHVTIRGRNYPVEVAQTNKLRFIDVGAIKFIEQNAAKSGKYGQMARSGHRITWCITGLSPRWGLVVDEKVESNVTPLKMRVISDGGFDKNWDVQFPILDNSQRFLGARFVVQSIFPAENGQYYRAAGTIAQLL